MVEIDTDSKTYEYTQAACPISEALDRKGSILLIALKQIWKGIFNVQLIWKSSFYLEYIEIVFVPILYEH